MQRGLAAAVLLFVASTAFAYENPVVTPSFVVMKPGETKTLALSTWWSGLTAMPQRNVFGSDAPTVAGISGSLTWVGSFNIAPVLEPIRVTALAPGVAHVMDLGLQRPYATVVVTCDAPGSGVAFALQERVTAAVQQQVTLEVVTAGFDHPSFAWFYGSTGDFRSPSSAHEATLALVLYAPGLFKVWAEVWDQCNYATIEFTVDVTAPAPNRRRAARH
ncbi:MAG TPA: hypothetical protein VF381_17015 [Thermoanaerobaculia bacterium]